MKKLAFSFGLIIVFAFYVLLGTQESSSYTAPQQVVSSNSTSANTVAVGTTTNKSNASSGSANPPKPTPTPTPAPATTAAYKDGTFTGSTVGAFYGYVQVAAVMKSGKLTDVQFLQYPSDNGHSMMVSNYALPALKQEAIQAQSANVNIVSGATATSEAFQQSLSSALAQAKN